MSLLHKRLLIDLAFPLTIVAADTKDPADIAQSLNQLELT
jgi:hypothetical protein